MVFILDNTTNAATRIAESQGLLPHQWTFLLETDIPHKLRGIERNTIVILHTACYGEIAVSARELLLTRDVALIRVLCPIC